MRVEIEDGAIGYTWTIFDREDNPVADSAQLFGTVSSAKRNCRKAVREIISMTGTITAVPNRLEIKWKVVSPRW